MSLRCAVWFALFRVLRARWQRRRAHDVNAQRRQFKPLTIARPPDTPHARRRLPPAARKADTADKRALVDKVDCFIFDCDGVIWRGDSVIDGVPETLDMLRAMVRVCACV